MAYNPTLLFRLAIVFNALLPIAAAFPAAWLLSTGPALAQPSAADKETARNLMKDGDAKFAAKDYAAALTAYQSANAIMQVPTTGLPLAKAQIEKGLLVEARDTLLQVTRHSKEAGEPAAFAKARQEAAALAAKIAPTIPSLELTIEGAPSGAAVSVKVDGTVVPAGALSAPRKVNPGSHTVTASAPGFSVATSTVTVKEGETGKVTLALKPAVSGAAAKGAPGPSGTIRVESPTQPGNVFLDGKAVGATPLDLSTSAGSHNIEIEYPGGTHERKTVTVPANGKEVAVFKPSPMDAVARHRKGVSFGFTGGVSMAIPLDYGSPLYGATGTFVMNIGITPAIDFRTGLTGTLLHRFTEYSRFTQLTATVPASLRLNWSPWFSTAAGLSVGFAEDFIPDENNLGLSIGPEWTVLSMCAGEKREFELAFSQGLRFGDVRREYHQSIVFTYLVLK